MLLELKRLEVPPGQKVLLRDVSWQEFLTVTSYQLSVISYQFHRWGKHHTKSTVRQETCRRHKRWCQYNHTIAGVTAAGTVHCFKVCLCC
ncbi:hypothetical protein NIES4073_73350 [Kalymmatonema gypsitolerans NIES-4073]|nr:hypothetical protein NIES4073_73350 [Scytonema sp. NIES-4073]